MQGNVAAPPVVALPLRQPKPARNTPPQPAAPLRRAQSDHWAVRWTLTAAAILVIGVLVILPVVNVFYHALANGLWAYGQYLLGDADTRHAILLTVTVASVAVALNLVFGVAAAWLIARFRFRGRTLL